MDGLDGSSKETLFSVILNNNTLFLGKKVEA
jgi:hypothetical protein